MLTILRAAVLAVMALAQVAPAPAWAQWVRADTDHVIIYGGGTERYPPVNLERVKRFNFLLSPHYSIPT